MTLLVVLGFWALALPVAGLLCARVLGYGERPSTPWDAWDVDAAGQPLASMPLPTHLPETAGR